MLLLIFFPLFPLMAACIGQGSLDENIMNKTGIPLVASTYMHWQVWNVNENSSNLNSDNILVSKSVGGVNYYGEGLEQGSVKIYSCAGGNRIPLRNSRAYDFGVSVGPYNFIAHQGSWPTWDLGLDSYFSKYLLSTIKWSNRDIYWTVYVPGKQYYTVKEVSWKERSECLTKYRDYSICWAVDLEYCNGTSSEGSCNTWADYYINNLGNSNGNYRGPLGKN